MKKITAYRYELSSPLGSDKYKYGDFYGISYLSDFKIKPKKKHSPISNCNKPGNINLYMICDSYIWSFVKTDSIFCNINKLKYAKWLYDEQIDEQIDTSKTNILIIEITERYARKLLRDTVEMFTHMSVYKESPNLLRKHESETVWEKMYRYLYNKTINQNIEFNLFDYSFLTPMKELKADLNFKVFGRVNNDVVVSTDKKYLFYYETTDSLNKSSSFNPISEQEISDISSTINAAYRHFRNLGFDEVYLSIIPNPVTILDPGIGKHNNLINRIQNRKDLIIPLINVLPLFKMATNEIYYRSDSHWNNDGFQIWVNETNKMLHLFTKNNEGLDKGN